MACEMQQIVGLCQELESIEWLQGELPLALRLRRSWSCGDIWDLQKACDEDDLVSYPDCEDTALRKLHKCSSSMTDASTCDDDDASSLSDETSVGDCIELESPKLSWAEEMQNSPASQCQGKPPDIWAATSESFALPSGHWTSTLGKLDGPPGKLVGPQGNVAAPVAQQSAVGALRKNHGLVRASGELSVSASLAPAQCPPEDLVKSVKNVQRSDPEVWFQYTAKHGENIRDPRKHTAQFLVEFLHQHNGVGRVACSKLDSPLAPDGKLVGPSAAMEKLAAPPGKLASPPGKMCAPPGKLHTPLGVAAKKRHARR